MRTVLAGLLLLLFAIAVQAHAADRTIVFSRIGDDGQEAWTLLKQQFEAKGYNVIIYQAEGVVEKHVEKVSRINRGPGRIFLAVLLTTAEKRGVVVAVPEPEKGEGAFLTIAEVPARFSGESEKLGGDVAAAFNVKVKHLPLFPLLGVTKPAAFVQLQFRAEETDDVVSALLGGVERYFSERTGK
jgi:hypothetical protein